jgi:hypothetical protein
MLTVTDAGLGHCSERAWDELIARSVTPRLGRSVHDRTDAASRLALGGAEVMAMTRGCLSADTTILRSTSRRTACPPLRRAGVVLESGKSTCTRPCCAVRQGGRCQCPFRQPSPAR